MCMFEIGSDGLLNVWNYIFLKEERYDTDNRIKEEFTGRCIR